jgi:hypothetical protein
MTFGAKFLHRPASFPLAAGSVAWGDREVALDLPGGPYRFTGLSAAQEASVRATFPGALLPPGISPGPPGTPARGISLAPPGTPGFPPGPAEGPPAAIRVLRQAAAEYREVDTRGWEYAMDAEWEPAAVRLVGLGLTGRLAWQPGLGGELWTPEDGGARFPGIFENYFRVLVAYRLLDLGGAILHSAGVVKDGAAYLFLGRSGAGKTTISRLSLAQGGEVLSDDLNALFPAPGGCVVRQLPFTGDLGERGAARREVPLAAVAWLEKQAHDAVAPLSRPRALACMLACSPFVNVDPYRRGRLESVLLALLAGCRRPPFTLRFALGGGFWSILENP